MAKTTRIKWADLMNTPAAKLNSKKIADLYDDTPAKGKSKYNNKIVFHDGIKFHSLGEGNRYLALKDDQRAGKIKDLRLQVVYPLTAKRRDKNDKAVRAMNYIADFVYTDTSTDKLVVEDFKGKRTQGYINKSKMMFDVHGIEIYETFAPTKSKRTRRK